MRRGCARSSRSRRDLCTAWVFCDRMLATESRDGIGTATTGEAISMTRTSQRRYTALLAGTAALLFGCPDVGSSAPKICTTAYDQCTLPNGVLGICDTVPCAAGEPGPCLVCRSQH
jgi:hypothetical protein